ncbi:transposase [Novosphingobium sp. TW-4]|uniref:Transposase n=1 Tax=Novosphingobium olei TaxID=2728851 RepID=A0A7Y0GBE6_9SPHN|nr:transposase [Novosphingobium olei]
MWRDEPAEWLARFVALLGDRRRARMCRAYIEGLIGPDDRKSVQPIAIPSPRSGYDQLYHFIAVPCGKAHHWHRSLADKPAP